MNAPRKISRNEVIRRFKAGEKVTDIARSFNVSKQNISQLISKYKNMDDPDSYKAERKERTRKVTGTTEPIKKAVILKLAAEGKSPAEIIAETGYRESYVRLILTQQGNLKPYADTKLKLILKLVAEGKSPAQIMFEAGIKLEYLRVVYRKNKLPRWDESRYVWIDEYETLVAAAKKKRKKK